MLAIKVAKGAGWLVFARLVGRGIDFVTLLILARALTPADFGLVALAMTLISIIDMVLEIPVTTALIRLGHVDKSHLDTGFTLGAARSLSIGLLVLLAAWPFALFYEDGRLPLILGALAIGPMARGLISPNMVRFARSLRFRQFFMMEVAGRIFASIAAVSFVMLGAAHWAIVANFVTTHVVATTVSYILAPYRPALSLSRLSDFAGFVGWFSASQLLAAVNWQFDRVLLGKFVDRPTLGKYAISGDLAIMPSQILVGPALSAVMAAFAQLKSDPERLRHAFLKAAHIAMLISAPTCIGISCTADLIVRLLLGAKWDAAGPMLQLLVLAVLTMPYFQTIYSLALAVDRPSLVFKLSFIDLGLRLAFITVGFYVLSLMGVIVARVVISVVMLWFYMMGARDLVGVGVLEQMRNIWKVMVAALVMGAAVMVFRSILPTDFFVFIELPLAAAVGAGAYAALLYAFGMRLLITDQRFEFSDRPS